MQNRKFFLGEGALNNCCDKIQDKTDVTVYIRCNECVLNVRRTVDLCIISESTERRLTLCIDVEGDYFIHRLLCQCHWTMTIDTCLTMLTWLTVRHRTVSSLSHWISVNFTDKISKLRLFLGTLSTATSLQVDHHTPTPLLDTFLPL